MRLSFQKKIILLFSIIVVIVIIIGTVAFINTQSLLKSNDRVQHTHEVLSASSAILSYAQDMEIGSRGFVITGDTNFLKPLTRATIQIGEKTKLLENLVKDKPQQLEKVNSLKTKIETVKTNSFKTIETRNKKGFTDAQKIIAAGSGKSFLDEIRSIIKEIENEEYRLLKLHQNVNFEEINSFIYPFITSLVIILLVLIVLFSVIRHNTISRNNSEKSIKKNLDEISNFKSLFESAPGCFLILLPDFTIDAVSDEYLNATMTDRKGILGKHLFEVFPDNPDDKTADGENNLRASLNWVLNNKEIHRMAMQKYDIRNQDGTFEVRYWSPLNKPVLNERGEVIYLIHSVEDVTVRLKNEQKLKDSFKEISDYKFALDESTIVSITDQKGIILHANNNFSQISKYNLEELVGQDHNLVNSGYHSKEFMRDLWTTITNGKLWKGEIKNRAKDGTYYWVDSTIIPILNNELKPMQYIAIRFDITLQKQQEEILKAQAEELKAQHEVLQEANLQLEAQSQQLQASEEELKAQQEELVQTNLELERNAQLLVEKNHSVNEKNEELETISLQLNRKADELALSSKYKSEFLANMSHELRTPLNSILLLSKLLADNGEENLTDEQSEFAKVIYNSGNSLLELINDILDLSKIESGKMDIDIDQVELDAICKNLSDLFIPLAKEKGISFEKEKEDGIPEFINTDRIKVEQVLKNFLSNAFKFTEKGNIKVIIRKPTDTESAKMGINATDFISFEVKDSGIGIPKEKHAMVFEAFQQADGSTRRKYGGTGLGLSISREIVRMLGGEILLTSELGKGSSFTMVIPLDSKSHETNSITINTSGTIHSDEKHNPNNVESDKYIALVTPQEIPDDRLNIEPNDKVILIVEDDITFVHTLIKYIHERGYKAIVAVSGANAITYATKYKPIGILLDVQLPVKSGWTVIKELKANPETKHIAVHVMSSLDIKAKDTIDMGAIDFITKPIADKEIEKVLNRIETVLKKIPKNILLVDNNEIHTIAISRFISDSSKRCITASSAKEAYGILNSEIIDCVVLDMGLPDETGYNVLEAIKKDNKLEKIPVIIYTGKSLSHNEEKKLKQYANAIVIKTADSFKRLSSEISLFLHLEENSDDVRIGKTPYIKEEILNGKRILIVDDDVRNIFSLTKLLEGQKVIVSSASDGNEALEILNKDKKIDLIMMDMMMPNKDGYETTMEIRKNEKLKTIPIIAVTAKAMLGDRQKCISVGASDYVTKPVDGDLLLSLLRVWLYK